MKLATHFEAAPSVKETVDRIVELERAGLDVLWIPEAYGFDAFSLAGFLAGRTERLTIGTGIVNVFSRTPGAIAMSAAGVDHLSGVGYPWARASGPQVIEGFHGVPYDQPLQRVADTIACCRMVWRREPLEYEGPTVVVPLPADQGLGLGKPLRLVEPMVRDRIPVWWASIMGKSVAATAATADGWIPALFVPENLDAVWGDHLRAGLSRRTPSLGPLEISAGGILAMGEDIVADKKEAILDSTRAHVALYVGGMGARGKNFYNDICRMYGYEREAAEIQERFLSGDRRGAAEKVPAEWLELSNFVGPPGHVAERIHAYKQAGVTMLAINPVGPDPAKQLTAFRELVDAV